MRGGEGLRGLSEWVQLYTGDQITFGDLTPYLTYASPQYARLLSHPSRPPVYAGTFYWFLTFRARVPIKTYPSCGSAVLKVFELLTWQAEPALRTGLQPRVGSAFAAHWRLWRPDVIAEHLCCKVHLKIVSETPRYDPNQTKICE
jgi:hypothetical protein